MNTKEVELNQKRTTIEGIYYCPKCCISNIYIGDENYNNKIIKCPNCGIEVKLKKRFRYHSQISIDHFLKNSDNSSEYIKYELSKMIANCILKDLENNTLLNKNVIMHKKSETSDTMSISVNIDFDEE